MRLAALVLLVGCSSVPESASQLDDTGTPGDTAPPGDDTGTDDSGVEETGTEDSADDSGTDTGEAAPCSTLEPTVVLSETVPGVFTVSWKTEAPTTARVEWGYEADYTWHTYDDGRLATDHDIVVAGPAPGTTIHWRAVSTSGDLECASDDQSATFAEGRSPARAMTLVAARGAFTSGFRVMAVSGDDSMLGIVDDEGRVVWSVPAPEGYAPLSARMDVDGAHVLFLLEQAGTRRGLFLRASLDQSDVRTWDIPYAHHSFVQHPDGTYTFIEADPREVEGVMVAGDALVHYDAALQGADAVWSSWDEWVPNLRGIALVDSGYYPDWLDWTHGNGLSLRADGSYLLSMHNVSKITNIDADGVIRWALSGDGSVEDEDLTFEGTLDELFSHQHSPSEVPGGIVVFDNGSTADHSEYSEAAEFEIDEVNGTFRRVWNFDWTKNQYIQIEGDVQRLSSGNTLVTWGSGGSLTEATAEGEVVWEASFPGLTLGFMELYGSIGGAVR